MNKSQRTSLSVGIILVVLGAFFIAANFIPSFRTLLNQFNTWPMITELVAACLFLLALMLGVPDMAVPATIVAGIGGILWWQNNTGNWASWSYMWALIPGFVGVGMLLAKILGGRDRYSVSSALRTIGSSLVMFVIFAAFFGGFSWMGAYWPLMLIVAGVLIGLNTLVKKR